MSRRPTISSVVVIAAGAVLCVVLAGLLFVPRGDDLRNAIGRQLNLRYGVTVTMTAASWQLLPVPAVTVRGLKTDHAQAITIRHISMVLDVGRLLLQQEISLDRIEVDGAVVPALSLAAMRGGQPAARPDAERKKRTGRLPVGHVRFRDVTWISRTGVPLPLEGEIDFDLNWRPGRAEVRRPEFDPPARLTLVREGQADRWEASVALGSGTADGTLQLTTRDDGLLVLGGTAQPRAIDVASAAAALNRRSPVGGEANGRTTVSAQGRTGAELARSLRLLTEFTMVPATVLRFDLDKAIRTLGRDHAGQTALKSLTGSMELQNTGNGAVIRFADVKTEGDTFTATGEGTVFMRRIDAHGKLALVRGLIGVPFHIRGTTRKPKISVFGGKEPALPDGTVPATPPAAVEKAVTEPDRARPAGVRNER